MNRKYKRWLCWSLFGVAALIVLQLSRQPALMYKQLVHAPQFILLVGLLVVSIYCLKTLRSGSASLLSLRKSKARPISATHTVTFADVGGCREAKEHFRDVIDYLKNPRRWQAAGVRLPRGILLVGPPGCGKTLLARAVAGETEAQFYAVSASEFVEIYAGIGPSRVRDMFATAARQTPAIIFIDELDAIGRKRGSGGGPGHDEREQTLNQLLINLDGFEQNQDLVVIGATNRPDVLDNALLRPGRFDRVITIDALTRAERVETLSIHTRNKLLGSDVCLETLADRTEGFSGAELENLANEAALLAVRRVREQKGKPPIVRQADFMRAVASGSQSVRVFDKLDAVLIESASQLSQPTGRVLVRLLLQADTTVEGEVVWADAAFIKIRRCDEGTGVVIPKAQVKGVEALAGTEPEALQHIMPDRWTVAQLGAA